MSVKFSQFPNGGAQQAGDIIAGLRAGVNTRFTASVSQPYNAFYASENAPAGGNGSISAPFDTFTGAYSAAEAVGTEANPSVVILEGNFTCGDWAISPYASVFGNGPATSRLFCAGTVSASAAWSTIPPSLLRNFVTLYGFALTASSITIAVNPGLNNQINIDNVEYIPYVDEEITIQGFTDGTVNIKSGTTVNYIGSSIYSSGSIYQGFKTHTNLVSDCIVQSVGDTFINTINCISHESKSDGFTNGTKIIAPNMANMSPGALTYSGQNTFLTLTADAILPQIGPEGIGTPILQWQSIGQNIDSKHTGVNYDSGNGSVTAAFAGIDTALAGAGGMTAVVVNEGYVLIEDNTLYIVSYDADGKVFFQTPPTMAPGFRSTIVGQGGNPISRWNLSTQLNQGLINGSDISNVGTDRYAILEPSSPTDRVSIVCTYEDRDVTVEFSSSSGLTIYEQIQIDRSLYSQTAASPLALYAMGQVDSAYTGYLLQVQRSGDAATAFVIPDLTYRASPLSMLDVGGNLAAWMYGRDITIIQVFDQSGNNYDAAGGAYWIQANGTVASMSSTNNTAMQFSGAQSFTGTLASAYTDDELNVFALSQITTSFESSVVTLYDSTNPNDYDTTLACVAFQVPPPLTSMATYRDATLSTKVLPANNTRMVLASRFDGADNILTINSVAGSTVASTGAFGFNKVLLSARFIGGAPDHHGYYLTACAFVYPSMSGGDSDAIQSWIDFNL